MDELLKFGLAPGSRNPYGNFDDLLDQITRQTGIGGLSDAYVSMIRGINHRGLGNPINKNLDNSGIAFFVRPDLNLSYDNIAQSRTLMHLGSDDNPKPTLQRAIRVMLDPEGVKRNITSPLFNHLQPFIPLLTNSLISLSGWPDRVPEVYASNPGIRKEQMIAIDGTFRITNQFELSANFQNSAGSPILALISAWLETAINCHDGLMTPYMHNVINNRLDYSTRIYHFTLDPGRRFIQQWVACGGGFPSTDPIGQMFNFQGTETMMQSSNQIPIQFSVVGADYNDPITFDEFNYLVGMFNPALKITSVNDDGTLTLAGAYYQIDTSLLKQANYWGTPLIHPYTNELMWFMNADEIQQAGLTLS